MLSKKIDAFALFEENVNDQIEKKKKQIAGGTEHRGKCFVICITFETADD